MTELHTANPGSTLIDVKTMTEVHRLSLARNETLASLFGALGVMALVLGAAGVYGVLSHLVAQRRTNWACARPLEPIAGP